MDSPVPRKRKATVTQIRKTTKTSLTLDVELATKLAAAAAMKRCSQNAICVEALTEFLGGIVVFDRRAKSADRVDKSDRTSPGLGVIDSDEDAA